MPTPLYQGLSRTAYAGDGVTTTWNFDFAGGYLDASHVKAYTETPAGVITFLGAVPIVGAFQVSVTPAIPRGTVLCIYRDTPKDAPIVDFTDGSGLSEVALDTNAKQAVFLAAEAADTTSFSPSAVAITAAAESAASALLSAASAASATASAAAAAGSAAATAADVTEVNAVLDQIALSGATPGTAVTKEFTATGGQTAFTLDFAPISPTSVDVHVNGVYQHRSTYSLAGAVVTLSVGAEAGDVVEISANVLLQLGTTSADVVEYLPVGIGAAPTTVHARLSKYAVATDFAGMDHTGVTDSTAGLQAALNSCGTLGGTVHVPNGVKLLIDGNLTIPANVSLVGPHQFVGTPQDNTAAPYGNLGGVLMLNSASSITLMGGASISGFYVWRKGMTFPATSTTAFAGTALVGGGDDVGVAHCLVMGFNKAYYSTGKQRPRIHNLYMDCLSGIDIAVCYDISYVTECHAWPFATIASPSAPIIRPGTAYNIRDVGDWAKFTNCFSYGYAIGASVSNVNSSTWLGCSFDNAPGSHPGSIGMQVLGNCEDTRIVNCQTAAHATAGILINTAEGTKTTITGHNVWGGMSHGVLVYGGNVVLRTMGFRDLGNAVSVTSATADIDVDDCWFRTLGGLVINATVPKANVRLGSNNDFLNVVSSPTTNMTLPSVASAASVLLPSTGTVFYITGTVGIGTLLHAWPGRQVTLIFVDAVPIYSSSGTSGSMRLNGGVTFSAPAGGSLTLCGIGGNAWVEVGRAA